jgi:uncharacterized damage-inducible protein DinB
MFRTTADFVTFWSEHSKDTQKILAQLTDAALGQPVAHDHRDLARMAWHLAVTIPEMGHHTGLQISGPKPDAPVPADADTIRRAYAEAAQSLAEQVASAWTDEMLLLEDELYGERWARGKTLLALVLHEVHHRGQMTVLMRQAGLKVPGVYGPAREEWAALGIPMPPV